MIKFSIIMPSFLGKYSGAASDRNVKIIRAIDSVIGQTLSSDKWELIIVSDGCLDTCNIVKSYLNKLEGEYDVKLYMVPKQKQYSGVRNFGISKASGEYLIYLDIDDYYDENYLAALYSEMDGLDMDWYFVNDYKLKGNSFKISHCDIKLGNCGTSNIIHKKELSAKWNKSDYAEDYKFIKALKKESENYIRLETVGYYVCHIPHTYDI